MQVSLKNLSLFMVFLMLMTSCYTYKEAQLGSIKANENVYSYLIHKPFEIGDKVIITTNNREYKNAWIESVNGSMIEVSNINPLGKKDKTKTNFQIEISTIDNLYIHQKDNEKTTTLVYGTVSVGIVIALIAIIATQMTFGGF